MLAGSRRPVAFDMTIRHNAPMAAQNRIRARRQSAIVSPAAPEMSSDHCACSRPTYKNDQQSDSQDSG
jgi:hypothetical protein